MKIGTFASNESPAQPGPGWTGGGARLGTAVYAAAGLSLVAALIHLWAAPEHFADWWAHGAFFLAAALCQGVFSVALMRWPGRAVSLAGIGGNLALVVLYVLSRTSGLPFGPHAGVPEEASVLGTLAVAAELGVVVLLLALLDGRARAITINVLFVVGLAIWALRIAGVLS